MSRKWIWAMAITFGLIAGYIEYKENSGALDPDDYGTTYGSCPMCGNIVVDGKDGFKTKGGDRLSNYHDFFVHYGVCKEGREEKRQAFSGL